MGSVERPAYQGLSSADLTDRQFRTISRMIRSLCGIHLKDGKEALVRARLMKRLRALRLSSFDEYLALIENDPDGREIGFMVDVLTTNKTNFFRESDHFHFFRDTVIPELLHKRRMRLRFWVAACSSGEEAFSLAILLRETMSNIDSLDVRILATDISTRMIEKARRAVFVTDALREVPPNLRVKYFDRIAGSDPKAYRVSDVIRKMVQFSWLNLIGEWPMKGPFQVIFCRNVMIYFDRETQQTLINRLWHLLEDGGYLFVGHSEGLSAVSHNYRYIRPAVYRK